MSKGRKNRKRKGNGAVSIHESLHDEKKSRSDESIEEYKVDCVPTRSMFRQQIEIGMKTHNLVLVEGPIGCGKTCLIREIAASMKMVLSIFQMGDQTDSKTLYGAFHCADIPGEFIWKPSTFTKVIRRPGIILLEDLDCASVDLISAVIDLCERRWARMNAGEMIRMDPQAFIVATMRTSILGRTSVAPDAGILLSSIPLSVVLPPFTDEELRRIICVKFGRVAAVARKLIVIFNEVVAANRNMKRNSRRALTSADLFRACERLQNVADLSDNMAVLGELSDVWALHCGCRDGVMELSQIISDHLSLNRDQLNYYLNLRLPNVSIEQEKFVCGRAALRVSERTGIKNKRPLMGVTRDVCQLMERVAVCITRNEPVLLVGETGVGKTSVVQSIAAHVNVILRVINLSQHSDSSDLIGGYKPVSLSAMLEPLKNAYNSVFLECFDADKNANFLSKSERCLKADRYVDFATIMCEIAKKALAMPSKVAWHAKWSDVLVRAERFKQAVAKSVLPFAYVRGVVAQAAECGDWLLVDEINLAPSECLDAIVHVMDDAASRHPDFRLFACMNPATDTGKRNLPDGVRTRFTEIFVGETAEMEQLSIIGRAYLPSLDARRLSSVLELYRTLCEMLPGKYSLRTLCRALSLTSANLFGGEIRSLIESISMAFLSDLDIGKRAKIEELIEKYVGKLPGNQIPKPSTPSPNGRDYVNVEGYWVEAGTVQPLEDPQYVCTTSVKKHLADLARIVCSGRYPVLLEGETSAGKTAMVTHLARITGNVVVRINNHEHTDLQEYIGSYAPDASGRLTFVEGALLKAVKAGHWVVLDELNLAPTDVIEALNRLLDDNRELFVSELNTAIKAHASFRLFATQNPVSTYAGRKNLSRALINRFVVLKFDHLPFDELAQMIVARCAVAPSSASKMVSVLCDLRAQRSLMGVFSARDGLMTLRDLFKWAKRLAISEQTDWQQCLADQGFFLLAARCRNFVDEELVRRTLEKHLKRSINPERLFAVDSPYMPDTIKGGELSDGDIVLTSGMRRMIVLCTQAWLCNEPVLMVGETGCGKTTVAEIIAKDKLLSVNCHERTETSDFLGSLRPVGDGTFRWMDGVVVEAMKQGRPLLIDEISLAADSVVERLNPMLEPSGILLLTDAGTLAEEVQAKSGFNVVATMNPGGDYGKRELSKALRNRFTELWCQSEFSAEDMKSIVLQRMRTWTPSKEMPSKERIAQCMVEFVCWFSMNYSHIFRCAISIRDIVAATQLFVSCVERTRSSARAIYHAFSATVFDALGAMPTRMSFDRLALIEDCIRELNSIMRKGFGEGVEEVGTLLPITIGTSSGSALVVSDFAVPFGPLRPSMPNGFTFEAPTCKRNIYRLARALSINKPILMEGAPGCGKSSTVVALAAVTGHPLTRLNLSDQTDLSDLFGSDVPIVLADGSASFAWRDGPVLSAIKNGHWILLDEMNLASQSVLEGLNACLDHRQRLFIAELNRTFEIGSGIMQSRFFACQNPRRQGGNRRALPKSFVNRFTSIYAEDMTAEDERIIIGKCFSSDLHEEVISKMVAVKETILSEIATDVEFATKGAPFEFNLRDLLRWAKLAVRSKDIAYAFDLLYVKRLRTSEDRRKMRAIFREKFDCECLDPISSISLSQSCVRIGKVELPRIVSNSYVSSRRYLVSSQISLLEQLAICVSMNWLTLLVGEANIGKASAVKMLADLTGNTLYTMRLTSETDALELLGSFEQVTDYVDIEEVKSSCAKLLVNHDEERDRLLRCEDALALRLVLQSVAYLVDEETAKQLRRYVEVLNEGTMRFQWMNSAFLNAFANGYWILVENVNCCSPAVLDRLNTCLESDGELVLSERGEGGQPIKAHPNFRVFFTMDEANGSISRAMRNRSIEIFILPEQNSWYHRISDVISIVSPEGCEEKLMNALSATLGDDVRLTSKQLIQLKVLMRGMPLDQILKVIDGNCDDTMEVDGNRVKHLTRRYPLIDRHLLSTLDEWKCAIWRVASDDDPLMGALWCLLSGTPRRLTRNGDLQNMFPACYDLMSIPIDSVLSGGFSDEYVPFDERFEGPLALRLTDRKTDYSFENRVILQAMSVWIWARMKATKAEEGSVAYISTSFLKKEVRADKLPSECVRYISEFINELLCIFPTLYCDLQCSFNLLLSSAWDILLFVRIASDKLVERIGCAPVHIAWQRMSNTFITLPFSSANLKHLIDRLSGSWSIVDEEALSRFLNFYKNKQIVKPFKNHENWLQVATFIETTSREIRGVHLSAGTTNGYEQEQNGYDERTKAVLEGGAFKDALKMISDVFGSFAILGRGDSRQALRDVCERATCRPIVLQQIDALDWIDESWRSIAHWLTFLCDDFAVSEFPLAFKNIDLARLPLGTELMQNIWRALHFDASLRGVTLRQFNEFTTQRDRFCFLLWKLSPHLRDLDEVIRTRLADILCHLRALVNGDEVATDEHFVTSASYFSLMKQLQPVGLALMRCATPVDNMVDPVIGQEYNFIYLKNKLDLINTQLAIVQRYQSIVSGQQSLCLYENSKHPLIASLLASHRKIVTELETYTNDLRAFRPHYNNYGRISLEMRSFLQMTNEWCGSCLIEFDGWENRSTEQLEIKRAQLESFLTSALTFCNRMITEHSAYADVVQPFVLGVRAVMLSVSYVRSEIVAVINLRHLMFEYSIPPSCKFEVNDLEVRNEQLLDWCLSDKSIMPKRLQLCVVYSCIRQRKNAARTNLCLAWIEREWSKWYERNKEKKEESFVYRKSGKTCEPVDEDNFEMMEMFPDYSSEKGDSAMSANDKEKGHFEDLLGDEDLAKLVREFFGFGGGDNRDTYLAMMWLIDATAGGIPVGNDVDSVLIVSHLTVLRNLCIEVDERIIDVYKTNCPRKLLRFVEAVQNLNKRLEALKEEWPEMTVLRDILQVSESVLSSTAALPQMQLAALLERLLGEAEHWEKVADRKHSISEELNVLREILVDWRKMEIVCWSELLQRVQRACSDEALLIAWPLFEAVKNSERQSEEIVAMCIEWVQRATMLDFETRLASTRLLAEYARQTSRTDSDLLTKNLTSIAAYFEQYSKVVASKFETLKSPIENQLRDFVKIVKYNDLNLWSVKLSAQKAHQQLFRIVKQFKMCGNEPVASLIDTFLPIPEVDNCKTIVWNEQDVGSCEEALVRRAIQIAYETAEKLHKAFSIETLNEILELTIDCDQLIRKEIVYEGEDEEKEKQQGRALAERQKAISLLLKRSAELGVRFRKGLAVDTERMTTMSVTGITGAEESLLFKLVRQCAASRSTTLKCLHKPHKKLSAQTIARLKGITEFALKELLQFYEHLLLKEVDLHKIRSALRMLRIHAKNVQDGDIGCIGHQQWFNSLRLCKVELVEKLETLEIGICNKLKCVPREQFTEYAEIYQISGLTGTPLSELYAGDPQYASIKSTVENICSLINDLKKAVDDAIESSIGCEDIIIWERDSMHALSHLLHTNAESLCGSFVELSQWMCEESAQGVSLCKQIIELSRITFLDSDEGYSQESLLSLMEPLLLNLQYGYKRLVDFDKGNEKTVECVLDRMKWLMSVALNANLDKSVNALWTLCSRASRGYTLKEEELRWAIPLATSVLNVFQLFISTIERFVIQFALYYLHFESIVVQLLQKGYVNSIPKMEEQREGEGGKMVASEDPAGMGNAEGDRDVGDEMDDMGQVEGLKGDNENDGEKGDQQKEDKPIDVDDDFAADLEGIDREEADEGSDEENEEEEPRIDEAMGRVDESEENKLDPELWDKEDEQPDEPSRELDQGNEGAKETTDQLTAKDDERKEQESKKGEEREKGFEGEHHDEEVDKENVDEREQTEETSDNEMTAEHVTEQEAPKEQEQEDGMEDVMEGKKLDENEEMEDGQNEKNKEDEEQHDGIEEEGETMEKTEEINEKDGENGEESGAEKTIATDGGGTERNEGEIEGEDQRGFAPVDQDDTQTKDSETNRSRRSNDPKSEGTSEKSKNDEKKDRGMDAEKEKKPEGDCGKKLADELERMETENLQEDDEETPENMEENNFAHITEERSEAVERLVIDKASVEEAKDSRTRLEQLRERNEAKRVEQDGGGIAEVDHEEQEGSTGTEEDGVAESDKNNTVNYASIINTTSNLYQLGDVSTMMSEVETMQMRENDDVMESDTAAEERWSRISEPLSVLSAELAENLRMIVEPTVASRLEGDYRSGKRLNMRRLIAYIASDYRKDRIWLRRTRKARRNYQILIAVDDSASMHENGMNLMACQSMCVIGTALHLLEVGQLAICKFGSKVKMLSEFCTYADSSLGGRLLTELTFKQDKTDLSNLLNISKKVLEEARGRDRSHQMMVIISDGRGVLADGTDRIVRALNELHRDQVTVLFVVVDSAEKSIVETKVAEFTADGQVELVPYMSKFPFPFYVVVRHISTLPVTLADAIRQWFELTAQST